MANHIASPPYFAVAFPFLFVGMWCLVSLVISAAGGWRRLAGRFPARGEACDRRLYLRSGHVGLSHYRGCLTIGTSAAGFRLSVLFPFRLGHPPLFIPWTQVYPVRLQRISWLESVVCEVGAPALATLHLPRDVFDGRGLV